MIYGIILGVSVGANILFIWGLINAEKSYNKVVGYYVDQAKLIARLIAPSKEKEDLAKEVADFYEIKAKLK
jgi:hypothetical protein